LMNRNGMIGPKNIPPHGEMLTYETDYAIII